MATTGRRIEPATLETARFVHVCSRADGDALAASGVLARACADCGTPFQVRVVSGVRERSEQLRTALEAAEPTTTLVIGEIDIETDADPTVHQLETTERPATLAAAELAHELGVTPDPVLVCAGAVAAGIDPDAGKLETHFERAREAGRLERRPGVGVPTADLVDGLAHTTRLSAPWSGNPEATADALAGHVSGDPGDEETGRTVGSLVALDTVGDPAASPQAATAIAAVMQPYATPDGPFETLEGLVEILKTTARVAPGTGVALAMGHNVSTAALEAWREHGKSAHETLESASTGRYDGLFVLGVEEDGPILETVAWLAANYRSPEPAALVVGDTGAAIASTDSRALGPILEASARTLEGAVDYDSHRRSGMLRFESPLKQRMVLTAVREAL